MKWGASEFIWCIKVGPRLGDNLNGRKVVRTDGDMQWRVAVVTPFKRPATPCQKRGNLIASRGFHFFDITQSLATLGLNGCRAEGKATQQRAKQARLKDPI